MVFINAVCAPTSVEFCPGTGWVATIDLAAIYEHQQEKEREEEYLANHDEGSFHGCEFTKSV
jgi:hypothetical protein